MIPYISHKDIYKINEKRRIKRRNRALIIEEFNPQSN